MWKASVPGAFWPVRPFGRDCGVPSSTGEASLWVCPSPALCKLNTETSAWCVARQSRFLRGGPCVSAAACVLCGLLEEHARKLVTSSTKCWRFRSSSKWAARVLSPVIYCISPHRKDTSFVPKQSSFEEVKPWHSRIKSRSPTSVPALKKLLWLLLQEFEEELVWDVAESTESVRGDFGRSWGVPAPSPLPTHTPREA